MWVRRWYLSEQVAELPGKVSIFKRTSRLPASYDIALIPGSVVGYVLAVYQYRAAFQFVRAWITVAVGISVFLVSVAKSLQAAHSQHKKLQTHDLDGCLYTLWATLTAGKLSGTQRLRITIHKPIAAAQRLEQVTEYVGERSDKPKAGRTFAAQSGIAGESMRKKCPLIMIRKSEKTEEFIQELISEYAFTEKDARLVDSSNYAWMAVPLFEAVDGTDTVRGVLFIDSTERDFFTPEREQIVVSACIGLSMFVCKRYN